MSNELEKNGIFTLALQICQILHTNCIDNKDEQSVIKMVGEMLKFRDCYSVSGISSSNISLK
jgi:hypothetical protein